MENNINSFTFYRDYFNLVDTIPSKDKRILLEAIVDYVFKDIEPNLIGHNLAIFNTLKNQLNLSKTNSKRRIKKEENINTKEEPKENQKETKKEPKKNKTSILSFKFYIYNFIFNKLIDKNINQEDINKLKDNIYSWLEYKQERKEMYKEKGLHSLIVQVENNASKYGVDAVCDLITECMASNYKGIIFEKLKKQHQPQQQYMSFQERKEKEWKEVQRKFLEGET